MRSHLAGVRGLKQSTEQTSKTTATSHLAGVRGLKLGTHRCRVAPRRGAWIETTRVYHNNIVGTVAPRRGAWIETTTREIEWQ